MPRRSRLARLLQAACLSQCALALAWLAWRWPQSPLQALAGGVTILSVGPATLGLELVVMSRLGSGGAVPAPTASQLAQAWLLEAFQMFRTFYWRQPFRWRAEPDHLAPSCAGRTGVVLVHGFMCNRGFWNDWLRELRARDRACIAVNLEPPFASIDAYRDAIDHAVRRVERLTGRPPVLVCHSMGGLAARAWWRDAPPGAVAHLVTIGTPHRGAWLARFSRTPNGRQMRLHSEWLSQLASDEQRHPLAPATCWHSNCDNVVFPAPTATLPGADNRLLAGVPHVALASDARLRAACMDLIERA
jgi:triacylglycerol lipase